ncbi:unnamed protein product, partial [Discosporangium mesarthrocarpum]
DSGSKPGAVPRVGEGSGQGDVLIATVDALVSEKHGRWFSFDDRMVTPISIRNLEQPFEGLDTAYLLIYRARWLDEVPEGCASPPHPSHAAPSRAHVHATAGAGAGTGAGADVCSQEA